MVEPTRRFTTGTGLVIGRTLVDPTYAVIPVLMVNASDEPVHLEAGVDAGVVMPVESIGVSLPEDNPSEGSRIELPPYLE